MDNQEITNKAKKAVEAARQQLIEEDKKGKDLTSEVIEAIKDKKEK